MLDGLLGSGFKAKCKSVIKATRARIKLVRRRAEAKQRFLKEDLAKLLANGLDINAFGRTEEFLAGQNVLASYDFIEQACEYILGQLSCMQKQRGCPEECREAVGSLMFAAARFSDLPELRDLRDLFQERYGNSLECFLNQKFLEILSSRPPERERRVKLLQDIASEYSIKWDSRGFEQRMSAPAATPQAQESKHRSNHVTTKNRNQLTKENAATRPDKHGILPKEKRSELANDGDRMHSRREEIFYKREDNIQEPDRHDAPKHMHEVSNGGGKLHTFREGAFCKSEDSILKTDRRDLPKQRPELVKPGHKMQTDEERDLFKWMESDNLKPININDGIPRVGLKNKLSSDDEQELKMLRNRLDYEKCDTHLGAERSGSSSHRKRSEKVDIGFVVHNNGMNNISNRNSEVAAVSSGTPAKRQDNCTPSNHMSERNVEISTNKVQEEEADRLHSYKNSARPPPYVKLNDSMLPPPYTKPRDSKHTSSRGSKHPDSEQGGLSREPSSRNRVDAVDHSDRILREADQSKLEEQQTESIPLKLHCPEVLVHNHDGMIPLPKPRSTRKKHHRSSSHQNEEGSSEDAGAMRRSSSSRRRDHSRKGLQIFFDDNHHKKDPEEKKIDKLLLHYSNKPSKYDMGKLRKKSHQGTADAGSSSHDQGSDVHDGESEHGSVPIRSMSLPHEHTSPPEEIKVYTRANSFQPDNQARHVHPKLPDYDDFVARLAAMRGR